MPGRSLAWFKYGKFGLPVAQHIGFDPDDPGHLANSEVELIGKLDLTHGILGFRLD